jgi:hypothetical protein
MNFNRINELSTAYKESIIEESKKNKKWITVKGAKVSVGDDGELQGKLGKKIAGKEDDEEFNMNTLKKYDKLPKNFPNPNRKINQKKWEPKHIKDINIHVEQLIKDKKVPEAYGKAKSPKLMIIQDLSDHARDMLKEGELDIDEAQGYIDNAVIMFEQYDIIRKEVVNLYLSKDGASVLADKSGNLITVYPNKKSHNIKPEDRQFYEHTKQIMKVVKEYEKKSKGNKDN